MSILREIVTLATIMIATSGVLGVIVHIHAGVI